MQTRAAQAAGVTVTGGYRFEVASGADIDVFCEGVTDDDIDRGGCKLEPDWTVR